MHTVHLSLLLICRVHLQMLLEVTRPQRVAILCLALVANMAICAVLLDLDLASAGHTAAAGLIAAVRIATMTLLRCIPI